MKGCCSPFKLLVVLLFLTVAQKGFGQHGVNDTIRLHAYITPQGDTIPESYLPEVTVAAFLSHREAERRRAIVTEWTRLRNAIYVTYPYAKAAARIMNELNVQLKNVQDRKARKAIIKSREKELKQQFTDKLSQLSVYQGRVLMKLIYRETGNNCYEIIQEYKGGFTAAIYQTVFLVVGGNLRLKYDPEGADAAMEKIVKDVQKMFGYGG